MRDDLFELDARRVLRRIYPCNEILEESAPAQNPCYGQIPRKPGHSLKLLCDDYDLQLVVINWTLGIPKNPTEFLFDAIFNSLDPQGMTQTAMKETNMRS